MRNVQRHWVVAALALGWAACAPAAHEQDFGFGQPVASDETMLVVRNEYFGELDIYALMGSTRVRLGSVMTGDTKRIRIPRVVAGRSELQLQADPVGPNAPFTFPVVAMRYGTMEMVLTTSLPMSVLVW